MALKICNTWIILAVSGREYDSVEATQSSKNLSCKLSKKIHGRLCGIEREILWKSTPSTSKSMTWTRRRIALPWYRLGSLVSLLERPALNAILAKGWYPNRTLSKVQAYPFKGRYLLSTGEFSDRANLPYIGKSEFDSTVYYRGKWRPCQTEGDEIIMVSVSHDPVTKQPKRFPKDKFDVREL